MGDFGPLLPFFYDDTLNDNPGPCRRHVLGTLDPAAILVEGKTLSGTRSQGVIMKTLTMVFMVIVAWSIFAICNVKMYSYEGLEEKYGKLVPCQSTVEFKSFKTEDNDQLDFIWNAKTDMYQLIAKTKIKD